jgi:hypothetical protein
MKKSLLFILLLSAQGIIAQNLSELQGTNLTYEAFFIKPNGDTLTREIIEMQFEETDWAFGQKDLRITYHTDTVAIKDFTHPFEKLREKYAKHQLKKEQGKKGWDNWTWLQTKEVTGYILTDSSLWMHPPRDNQYLYNEISGMPEVNLKQLFIGGSWTKTISIMMGWHDFKGTLESDYQVAGQTAYEKGNLNIQKAWEIKATHSHSELGKAQSRILFDKEQYGFLHFDNIYHDGNRIVMNLIKVESTANKK